MILNGLNQLNSFSIYLAAARADSHGFIMMSAPQARDEHAYTTYSHIHGAGDSQPAVAAARSTPSSFNNFLDDICMVNVANTAPQAVDRTVLEHIQRPCSQFQRSLELVEGEYAYLNFEFFAEDFFCRNTRPSSSVWPATFWRSPATASPSSVCSRVHTTSATRLTPR